MKPKWDLELAVATSPKVLAQNWSGATGVNNLYLWTEQSIPDKTGNQACG
jgi:hypothetical protein